jgi:ribosomal protection tetracycline resistance protein
VVVPVHAIDKGTLRVALAKLAEQDPLINVRQDDTRHEISVSLYGEVQKEVVQATLASDFGIDVTYRETTTICIERPARTGEAVETLHGDGNPFLATIGLRVEPGAPGSGVEFRLRVDTRTVPIYIYKNADQFADIMGEYARRALREGLYGWEVSDCVVTMIRCNYSSPDGPPSTRGPLSTAADFRNLTPIVLMRALADAGTVVCEPIVKADLEIPTAALGPVLSAVVRLGGAVRRQSVRDEIATVEAVMPAARVHDLQGRLPGLTAGEGMLESAFGGYQPVRGETPIRPRTTANPLNREEYLMYLTRQGAKA